MPVAQLNVSVGLLLLCVYFLPFAFSSVTTRPVKVRSEQLQLYPTELCQTVSITDTVFISSIFYDLNDGHGLYQFHFLWLDWHNIRLSPVPFLMTWQTNKFFTSSYFMTWLTNTVSTSPISYDLTDIICNILSAPFLMTWLTNTFFTSSISYLANNRFSPLHFFWLDWHRWQSFHQIHV